ARRSRCTRRRGCRRPRPRHRGLPDSAGTSSHLGRPRRRHEAAPEADGDRLLERWRSRGSAGPASPPSLHCATSMANYLFTSESVTEGHPDKVCDAISDAVLDAIITQDKKCRVACETFTKTGFVLVGGEIT